MPRSAAVESEDLEQRIQSCKNAVRLHALLPMSHIIVASLLAASTTALQPLASPYSWFSTL